MSQVIQIPIGAGGIDVKTAKEYVDPNSKALAVTNGIFTHDGSVEKRRGCVGLVTLTVAGPETAGPPLRVASRQSETLYIDGNILASYSPTAQLWVAPSHVSPCEITRHPLSVTNTAISLANYYTSFSLAEGNGYRIVVYRDASQNILWDLYDLSNGANLGRNSMVGQVGYAPTVIIIGTKAYLFYSTNTSSGGVTGTIWGSFLDLSSNSTIFLGWSPAMAIVTDGATGGTSGAHFVPYEATPEAPSNIGILLIYPQHSTNVGTGASQSTMLYFRLEALPAFTIAGLTALTSATANTVCTTCCARYDSSLGYVWFGWEFDASGTYTQSGVEYTTAWSNVASAFTLFAGASAFSVLQLECDFDTTVGPSQASGVFIAGATGTVAAYDYSGTQHYKYVLQGVYARPFRMTCGGATHTFVLARVLQQTTYQSPLTSLVSGILFDASRGGIAGSIAPRQCAFSTLLYDDARLLNVTNVGQTIGVVDILLPANATGEFNAGATTSTTSPTAAIVNLATFDFTGALTWQPAEGDGETFFSGGLAATYDTKAYQELGWLVWPDGVTFVNSTSGGTIPDGTYEYAIVYAYIDDSGLAHRSFPWTVTITTAGGGTSSIAFTIPATPFTLHNASGRQPIVEVYRTNTNLSTLYYLSGVPFTPGGSAATFTDLNNLFSASNVLLYTTGGVLPSVNAPALRCMIKHVERLWGIDDTGLSVWYSQPLNGVDAPYFNEALTLQFTDQILTALGEMDDKLVIFTATGVWYVEGQGPGTNGQGSDLNVAVQIPSDVGAGDWRGVVSFPGGVFFQAPTGGIYLLDRGLGITYKGKDVQDLTCPPGKSPATVLSATLVADGTTVRFALSTGVVLVYNYFFDRWSTTVFTQPSEGAGAPFGNATTSCMAAGVWTAATNQGIVIQEKPNTSATANYDTAAGGSSSWVSETITLPWLKPGGLQGWSQVDLVQGLARLLDPCNLSITLAYDYGAGTTDAKTYTYAQLAAQNTIMAQWRVGPSASNMQPEAISVTLSDAPPTGGSATTGAGVQWLGAAFRVTSLGTIYDKLGTAVKQ